jgi:spore germination protein GerM
MIRTSAYCILMSIILVSLMSAQKEKQIKLYFQNNEKETAAQALGDSSAFPVQVFPVQRKIRTDQLEREALKLLLLGPTKLEQENCFSTNCSGLKLKKLKISRGSAVVYLTGKLQLQGLLSGPRLRLQIEKTLKQFRTVRRVTMYINNKKSFDDLK